MDFPLTVEQFFAEVSRQTLAESLAARDGFRDCFQDTAEWIRGYLALWIVTQRRGLRTALEFHDAALHASHTLLDATLGGCLEREGPARLPRENTEAIASWEEAAAWLRGLDGVPSSSEEWAESALNFQPPIGIITEGYGPAVDGED